MSSKFIFCELSIHGLHYSISKVTILSPIAFFQIWFPGLSGKTNPLFQACFAASDSPYATNDTTLAVLMAEYFRQFSAVRKVSVTVLTAQHFDTRGEVVAFWEFALRRGFRDLTIVAAEYHLPRVRVIVQQECGRVVGHQMRYELVFDPVGRIAHLKEWVKRYFHVYLPPDLGRVVVRGIRRFGLNTSW